MATNVVRAIILNCSTRIAVEKKNVKLEENVKLEDNAVRRSKLKLTLFVLSGEKMGQMISFKEGQIISFGRTTAANYSFEDDLHMSSIHFEVEHKGRVAEIRDRGSRNGTWINGDRIQVAELQDGHRIKAGHTLLRVSIEQPALAPFNPIGSSSDFHRRDFDEPIPEDAIAPTIDVPSVSGPLASGDPYATDAALAAAVNRQPDRAGKALPDKRLPDTEEFNPEAARSDSGIVISPIESVYSSGGKSPISNDSNAGNLKLPKKFSAADTPFGADSSQMPDSASVSPAAITPQDAANVEPFASDVQFLHKAYNPQGVEATLHTIVTSLQSRMSMVAIAHFQKIRMTTPPDLTSPEPLFDWLPTNISRDYGPVLLNWEDWERIAQRQLLGRLCRADGLIVFLGTNHQAMTSQIKQMLRTEIIGFSEANGFLGCCWPSTFTALRYCAEKGAYSKLFGNPIFGAILSPPQRPLELAAIAKPTLATSLSEFGFVGV